MLIEVKTKVKAKIEDKVRVKSFTYILDEEFFSNAEYKVTALLNQQTSENEIEDYEILSLKQSTVKEVATQYYNADNSSFIATFKETFVDDNGKEKSLRYKILLWAVSLTDALNKANEIQRQGYDLVVEGVKEVNYVYLTNNSAE